MRSLRAASGSRVGVRFVNSLAENRTGAHNRFMEPVIDPGMDTAELYRSFAMIEAPGLSPTYEAWALGIAGDPEIIALIDQLPAPKRQVNLVFAAARAAGAGASGYPEFRRWLVATWDRVRDIALSHATQTNEAGRCAVLLPLLAALPQPLAIIEVGASAGLCLYPDRYSYRYGDSVLHPDDGPSTVLLSPRIAGPVPVPDRMPRIAWRAGLDLNPLDVSSEADVAWLEALVWPEHDDRRERLRAAIEIVRKDPPRIVRTDALSGLRALVAEAPKDTTVVVYHSAALAYFTAKDRNAFAELVRDLPVHWISNEGELVVPGVREKLPVPLPDPALFVLAQDGEPVAFAGGHGQSLYWIG
ncbi:MAG: hypothetical protein QOK46_1601 [Microbacteriaceae bacterium]|nr:hypothetical protein [Microbacteriaceae bacterium]